MQEKDKQRIREEFINNPELAGEIGYCNEVMADKIASWFLSQFDTFLAKKIERIDSYKQDCGGEYDAGMCNGIDIAINILKE